MDSSSLAGPKRRFAGRGEGPDAREDPFDALAEAFLPPRVAAAAPAPVALEVASAAGLRRREGLIGGEAAAPDGLYVMVPAGIEPGDRRRAALEVARHLAPPNRPAAIFIFDGPRVDAHILGEVACGRLGPQNYLTAADIDRTLADLVGQCAQVGIALVGAANGELKRLGLAACRTIFVSRPDAESLIETYRGLKSWRQGGAESEAALLVLGGEGGDQARRAHRRLRKTVRAFLGCDLAIQGFLAAAARNATPDHSEPLCVLSQTPAEQVWPRLLAAARGAASSGRLAAAGMAAGVAESGEPARVFATAAAKCEECAPPTPDVCPVFSVWKPADRAQLLAAIEAQAPSLVAADLRLVFRVDVDEPGAPPLVAVRADGALVAILVTAPGEAVDTSAAERWLTIHRRLLARAYPSAGIAAEGRMLAVALAPLEPRPAADGLRRFLPVRMGGHRGVVLLP